MTVSELIKPGPALEADGILTIYEIESGAVVAQYEGIGVYEKIEYYKKFEFEGNTWFGMVMDSIGLANCANCGKTPHVTVDDNVRCCICGMD